MDGCGHGRHQTHESRNDHARSFPCHRNRKMLHRSTPAPSTQTSDGRFRLLGKLIFQSFDNSRNCDANNDAGANRGLNAQFELNKLFPAMLFISSDGLKPRFVSLPNVGHPSVALVAKRHNCVDNDPVEVMPLEYSQSFPSYIIGSLRQLLNRAQVMFRKAASHGKKPFKTTLSSVTCKTLLCVTTSRSLIYLGRMVLNH